MAEPPQTRASLLVRLRDGADAEAWRQFVDLYAPLIYGQSRKRGLQDADAADVTQEVFRAVAGALQALHYDPRRGSFRGWLYTVTRNKINDFRDRQKRHAALELPEEPPARDEEAGWERDYQRRVLAWAAGQVRGEFKEATWRAFWLVAVEGKNGEEAAGELGMSVGAVYVAKSRVLARLKECVRELEEE